MVTNPLDSDRCVYIEWSKGDNGNHLPAVPEYWLSPGINIVAPVVGQAAMGVTNTVRCVVHLASNCDLGDAQEVIVEAFCADPSAAFKPGNPSSSFLGNVNVAVADLDPSDPNGTICDIPWMPNGVKPQTPGHRCLLVRAYPDTKSPTNASFFLSEGDRHVGQHNITIVQATNDPFNQSPHVIRPGADGLWHVPFAITNDAGITAQVGILVDRDHDPAQPTIEAFEPLLAEVQGFPNIDVETGIVRQAEPPVIDFVGIDPQLTQWDLDPVGRLTDGLIVNHGDSIGGIRILPGTQLGGLTVRPGDLLAGRLVETGDVRVGFEFGREVQFETGSLLVEAPLSPFARTRWSQLRERRWDSQVAVQATLSAGATSTLKAGFDLRALNVGEAQVFHVQQSDTSQTRPEGGLTIVLVKVS